jgi:hypothetical protein
LAVFHSQLSKKQVDVRQPNYFNVGRSNVGQFAERAIRSMKMLIRRGQYQKSSNDWPSLVAWAVKTMNDRVHSATGMRPSEVTPDNAMQVYRRLYPYLSRNRQPPTGRRPTLSLGDHVRILIPSQIFVKGFEAKTSLEVYKIARILFHSTIRYKLSNIGSNAIVAGSFTANELIPVKLPQRK